MMRSILPFIAPLLLGSVLASCYIDTRPYRAFAGAVREGIIRFDSTDVSRGSTDLSWVLYKDSLTRCSTSFSLNLPTDERSTVEFVVENRMPADVTLTDVWARFQCNGTGGRLCRLDTFKSAYREQPTVDSIRYRKDRVWYLTFPGGIPMSVELIYLECGFTMHFGNEQQVVHERLVITPRTKRSILSLGKRH